MAEIKISVSEEMDALIKEIADTLGIKKTEYIKSLVIENLKQYKLTNNKKVKNVK